MGTGLKTLSGLDATFLYLEGLGTPMHVGSLMLLKPPKRRRYQFHEAVRTLVQERLPGIPALRRRLHEAPLNLGHPVWSEGAEVDLDYHIQLRQLRPPGSDNALNGLVARLHAEPLDRERPLWQLVVIEGLASGEVALYAKLHHALLDGQGGVALAKALLDVEATLPTATAAVRAPAEASADPSKRDLAALAMRTTVSQFGRLVRALPSSLRMVARSVSQPRRTLATLKDALHFAPRTPFNAQVGPGRAFAGVSLELATVKRVAKGFCVSLNDVVLALCASALREYLSRRGELPEQKLIAAMPVSLRSAGATEMDNQVSMVQCALPTDIADPVARLLAIQAATRPIKERVEAFRHLIPTDFPGIAAPLWATGLSRLWARGRVSERLPPLANLVISNVPGPPMPLFLAGSAIERYYPVSIITHGLALNITVFSYAGRLEFGLVSCREALAKPELLGRALERALSTLVARLPP